MRPAERIGQNEKLLVPYRVLDLTSERGLACGKVLADMGAEVIKVERPGGDSTRRIGPFYGDVPHPERSLSWFAFNQGKKGITLNFEHPEGKNIFLSLVKLSHIVIESYSPGYLDSLGLGYKDLSRVNSSLILTSITAFGQTGPYSHYKDADIIVAALSGYMYLCGEPQGPPLRISFPITYYLACLDAVAGSLIALYHSRRTGKGQRVDASAQQAVVRQTSNAPSFWDIEKRLIKRAGPNRAEITSRVTSPHLWKCKDGWISFVIYGGQLGERITKPLMAWMESEGMMDNFLRSIDWKRLDMANLTREFFDAVQKRLADFFLKHTKAELFQGALERRIVLYPVCKIGEILQDEQLSYREYWTEIDHPELGRTIRYPGAFVRGTVCRILPGQRAPLIGEHNRQVYGDLLGVSASELEQLKDAGVI